jgi:hypothetical protein
MWKACACHVGGSLARTTSEICCMTPSRALLLGEVGRPNTCCEQETSEWRSHANLWSIVLRSLPRDICVCIHEGRPRSWCVL